MPSALKQPAQRQPLASVDPKTGSLLITREWYNFLFGIYERVGGALGEDSSAFAQGLPEDAGLEELKHQVFAANAALEQATADMAHMRAELDELRKAVQSLQQSTLI